MNNSCMMIFFNKRAVLEALSDAERGQLTLALLDYLEYGRLPAFEGALSMAFLVLRSDADCSVKRWEAECARRSAAGKKSAALRAAKKFAMEVSCNDDAYEETESSPVDEAAPEPSALKETQQGSTAFNTVEDCSTNAARATNQNTKSTQTIKSTGSPPVGPQRGRDRDFERFWSAYPRKVGKQAARKAFVRAGVPLERLLSALERQRGDPQWQREQGRFIPNPVTWLNQARWEDEPPTLVPRDSYGVENL